jgi:hypothetical protein
MGQTVNLILCLRVGEEELGRKEIKKFKRGDRYCYIIFRK